MKGLLGKKVGMTQVFTEKGDCVPVTVVQVEKCVPVMRRLCDYKSAQLRHFGSYRKLTRNH